ncbi:MULTISPECIES: adenylosuccinate lyase family protein [unclassified Streptomyces]|uniref:class-II fumarase/aspartase family protein n=1 Tax=unclassified Streptomyces TaxID=2593676 RepID=UPI002E81DDDB|nr:adenylosuccinate lyase family protein [Streptomyces sp. NBC_00589]WTI35187.1 adenylosuccinate lyase family protein [Streptomyces sp. NBC_00775]WUB31139.1 adenylosuccinate lyase family protein [Streptomyces sp. NBC_00589]
MTHALDAHQETDVLTDSGLLSPVRAGTPVEAAVCDRAWLQAMLDAEAALARAQARLGTVPKPAADIITRAARADRFDARALALASRETANPVVGLVQALTRAVAAQDEGAAEYVHRGSTSQDVLDTGAMLVTARALRLLRADLTRIADALGALALEHRDTLMAGRTLALQAVPTTFGLKAAGWRELVLDAVRRVERVLDGGLPVSLGGAAGTLAGYLEYAAIAGAEGMGTVGDVRLNGDDGVVGDFGVDGVAGDAGDYLDRLVEAFAAETGLAPAVLPWHALRTPIADVASVLAFTAGALGKIAVDVQSLTRTEVGEVTEPTVAGRGSSSAMPHKRNPVLATLMRAAALQVPVMAAGLTQCLLSEDERSAGAWHAEWQLLRECLRLVGGSAHTAVELAKGLVVNPWRMRENLAHSGAQIVSERIAAVLAPWLGKVRAKQVLTDAVGVVRESGRGLPEVLAEEPSVARLLSAAELVVLCDPAGYTGGAGPLVDRALRSWAA